MISLKTKKSNKVFFIWLIFFTIVLLVNFVGCKGKKAEFDNIIYSKKTAELISHITSGIISASDDIFVRFVAPVIKTDQVGSVLKKSVFSFSPEIQGITRWKDQRTLTFLPNKKLKFGQKYTGTLDLKALVPKNKQLTSLTINFIVAPREIIFLTGDFELKDINNPNLLVYKGNIVFSEPIDLELVKNSVFIYKESRQIPLQWDIIEKDSSFSFTTIPIRRPQKSVLFVLRVDKKSTELADNIIKSFSLEPLKDFKLKEIVMLDQGKKPGLELKFSDTLDLRQDITGLIRIIPRIDISQKAIEKSIFLSGDFKFGEKYKLIISRIRSKWGSKLSTEITRNVDFEDKKPQISFLSDGAFLPSTNQRKIGFKTMNVRKINVNIYKVFESNLGQFLQTEQLNSKKQRNTYFNSYNVNRVGIPVVKKDLSIGNIKNQWLNHQLDLNKLMKPEEKGLFLVSLTFRKVDMLYSGLSKERRYFHGSQYYSNPSSSGYLWRHGRIYKPIILSDIGLTYKKGTSQHVVLATNIITSSVMADVKVTLRTYQNQIIESKYTNNDGLVFFNNIKKKVFFVEAEKKGQKSIINPSEMAWNLSAFDIGGEEIYPDGTRVFIYTERGVYRPGDEVNISIIARNEDNTFPDNHPITLKIYNPKNQLVFNRTIKNGRDGFYSFSFKTKPDDLTGNWRIKAMVGSKTFYHALKIETVAPYRLKVNLEPEKMELNPEDKELILKLSSNYLFGNPASFLNAEVSVSLQHQSKRFNRYNGFIFNNESIKFKSLITNVFKGALNENGKALIKWSLPLLHRSPSALIGHIIAKVFEKGGRASRNDLFISVNPFTYYVGLQKPKFRYGYSKVGAPIHINTILVNRKGQAISGRNIHYRIYRNSRYWWWEYNNRAAFRIRFKKDSYTKLVKEGSLISRKIPVDIEFKPEIRGEYFIEVQDGNGQGHLAGFFFSAYYWGDSPVGDDSAGTIILKSDKKIYSPGETARIFFSSPEEGIIYVSVEKAHKILKSWVSKAISKESETVINVPITTDMLPNAYVSISLIQPHSQTLNDRPFRMYGVIPLSVEDPDTRYKIQIKMADELRSNQDFTINLQAETKKTTQFTIAIVDEGLLDITQFKTPDPWENFFKKQRLAIRTFDLFSSIIGVNKGDIFQLFSIGGEMESKESYRKSQQEPGKKKRFKAVSMFKGPFVTDNRGFARVSFKMPDYIGSVRVMVVSARKGSYSMAEKTVPVKTELMVLPTLPRVLGPEDKIVVPVSVFALKEKIKKVDVSIHTKGPVDIVGSSQYKLVFHKPGEKDVKFSLKVYPAVGDAEVTVKAVSGSFKVFKKANISIRPYSPRIYTSDTKECVPGKKVAFVIPGRGIPGTNQVSISVMRKSRLNLNHRLYWLIHYPYGCIEQTISAAFPQLYLKEFLKQSSGDEDMIDQHINAAIERLRRFQTSSGGFASWPGGSRTSIWGTNYAGHFLIEAKKLGYNIPVDLLNGWIRFQKSRAILTRDSLIERVYRLYGLSLADEAQLGSINLLKENNLNEMNSTEKWLLAAAYHLAGQQSAARDISKKASVEVKEYSELGGSYGSWLRDKSIILEITTLLEDWNKADKLYDQIVLEISSHAWYSTHTLGYALLALGKYIQANRGDFRDTSPIMKGYLKIPGEKKINFNTDKLKFSRKISKGFGKKAEIYIDKETNLRRVFVVLDWNGVPIKPDVKEVSKNLWLQVEWLDENGMAFDPATIKQGTTFWGHFRVGSNLQGRRRLDELALVQVIPSGWEIENIRLLKEELPGWMSKWILNKEEYLDIRDDRIMWFFDLPWNQKFYDFVVKLTAVTSGEFILPPTLFEAMYNNNYKAVKKGKKVTVKNQ